MAPTHRVLVVDDDEALRSVYSRVLTKEGYTVQMAASAEDALAYVKQERPDAILLDLRMPLINGVGFLYRLRAQTAHRHTPVAIITGDSCIDDPALSELHGLEAEVCFKPMWIDEVITLTRSLLAKRRPVDPLLS